MPSINYLNPPPHPFWDFVANLEEHPLFAAYARPGAENKQDNGRDEGFSANAAAEGDSSTSNTRAAKQPTVEDEENEEDPTLKRGVGQSTHHDKPKDGREEQEAAEAYQDIPFRGRRGCHPGRDSHRNHRHDHGRHGPPGFGFGPFGPFGPPHRGPPGPFWGQPGAHLQPPHGSHHPFEGRHRGGCGRGGRRHGEERGEGPGGFDVGSFLNNLGNKLGLDLSGAAEGLGLDRFTGNNGEADFDPRADVFDTPNNYVAHVSLPGAKKQDIGVDWDGEHSALRVAGVAYRPNVDEGMMKMLAVDGRKRETGVFEKVIKLGTRREPAYIDVSGIAAKMQDGILIVTVPKLDKEKEKREVPITSPDPSPRRSDKESDIIMEDQSGHDEVDAKADTRSETEQGEGELYDGTAVQDVHEELPAYATEDHQDSSSTSGDEGEYVKIDVD